MPGPQVGPGRIMEALLAIFIFIGVIFALDRYEFGRFD
jgi:hypothetical protein